VAERLKAPAC